MPVLPPVHARFAARSPQDVADLVQSHPLAWVVSCAATVHGGPLASAVPLLVSHGPDGRITRIEGHLPRHAPHAAALRVDPQVRLLWMGPNAYVSPSWMADRTQAPTWNFAAVQCRARLVFDDDPAALRTHLEALVNRHEAAHDAPWRVDETGARYTGLAERIVAFHAEGLEWTERFKLGQDERDDVYADILRGLRVGGHADVEGWMRRFNPGRPDCDTT